VRINEVTSAVIRDSLKVHSFLGPGVLESAYHTCLVHELRKNGCIVRERVPMPVVYDGLTLEHAYEADLIVNEAVIVEVKAVTRLHPIHLSQLLSYLVLSGLTVGLLINFHELHLRDGIRRVVHRFRE
jgi:GxxExxY protein